jgi:hypothetical protein
MLEDVAGSRTFSTASPDCHACNMLSVNLLSSVKSTWCQWRICQSWCSLANAKRLAWCWAVSTTPTCGRQALIPPSWSLFHMHICGLLEVILPGSGSAPPAPPCTKAEVTVLLLGCCPPTASSTSPDVLACLLVAPPCSGQYADRHSKPSCHSSHWMCHPG